MLGWCLRRRRHVCIQLPALLTPSTSAWQPDSTPQYHIQPALVQMLIHAQHALLTRTPVHLPISLASMHTTTLLHSTTHRTTHSSTHSSTQQQLNPLRKQSNIPLSDLSDVELCAQLLHLHSHPKDMVGAIEQEAQRRVRAPIDNNNRHMGVELHHVEGQGGGGGGQGTPPGNTTHQHLHQDYYIPQQCAQDHTHTQTHAQTHPPSPLPASPPPATPRVVWVVRELLIQLLRTASIDLHTLPSVVLLLQQCTWRGILPTTHPADLTAVLRSWTHMPSMSVGLRDALWNAIMHTLPGDVQAASTGDVHTVTTGDGEGQPMQTTPTHTPPITITPNQLLRALHAYSGLAHIAPLPLTFPDDIHRCMHVLNTATYMPRAVEIVCFLKALIILNIPPRPMPLLPMLTRLAWGAHACPPHILITALHQLGRACYFQLLNDIHSIISRQSLQQLCAPLQQSMHALQPRDVVQLLLALSRMRLDPGDVGMQSLDIAHVLNAHWKHCSAMDVSMGVVALSQLPTKLPVRGDRVMAAIQAKGGHMRNLDIARTLNRLPLVITWPPRGGGSGDGDALPLRLLHELQRRWQHHNPTSTTPSYPGAPVTTQTLANALYGAVHEMRYCPPTPLVLDMIDHAVDLLDQAAECTTPHHPPPPHPVHPAWSGNAAAQHTPASWGPPEERAPMPMHIASMLLMCLACSIAPPLEKAMHMLRWLTQHSAAANEQVVCNVLVSVMGLYRGDVEAVSMLAPVVRELLACTLDKEGVGEDTKRGGEERVGGGHSTGGGRGDTNSVLLLHEEAAKQLLLSEMMYAATLRNTHGDNHNKNNHSKTTAHSTMAPPPPSPPSLLSPALTQRCMTSLARSTPWESVPVGTLRGYVAATLEGMGVFAQVRHNVTMLPVRLCVDVLCTTKEGEQVGLLLVRGKHEFYNNLDMVDGRMLVKCWALEEGGLRVALVPQHQWNVLHSWQERAEYLEMVLKDVGVDVGTYGRVPVRGDVEEELG